MNVLRNIQNKIVAVSRFGLTVPKNRWTGKYYEPRSYNQWNSFSGRYIQSREYPHYGTETFNESINSVGGYHSINENYGRKRRRDSSDDVHLNVKRFSFDEKHNGRRNDGHYDAKEHSFSEVYGRKRAHNFSDDHHEAKKPRFSETFVNYAIKRPSQHPNPNRKILEALFDAEITADGWEKKSDDEFQYHTKIRGKCFYEKGKTIDNAKEYVAESVLKELCNFKSENVFWPENLLPFRLNQDFADEIER